MLERQSNTAGELASAFADLRHQEWLEHLTPARAAERIEVDFRAIDLILEHLAGDWPQLAQKLTREQRDAYTAHIRWSLERLIVAMTE